jgi:hypothetical protein
LIDVPELAVFVAFAETDAAIETAIDASTIAPSRPYALVP